METPPARLPVRCATCLLPVQDHAAGGCTCGHPLCLERATAVASVSRRGRGRPVCERHLRAELVTAERYQLVAVVTGLPRQQAVG